MKKVALCIIATRNYKRLLEPLLESVKKYFLTQHELSLFIFADSSDYRGWLDLDKHDVCWTRIEHLTFPLPTLFRHKTLLKKERELSNFDYVFHCDADARFVGEIGNEILGEGITAIQHPSAGSNDPEVFWDLTEAFKNHALEHNPDSLAYIAPEERKKYFCGAIQGGLSKKYIEAMKVISQNIDDDLGQNIIARYHDESHWNKYLSQNPPHTILPFWYCFPESKDWPTRQVAWKKDVYVPEGKEIKMLCLDKDLHGGYSSYRGKAKR
jgi:histo-blood group ABO system transferase